MGFLYLLWLLHDKNDMIVDTVESEVTLTIVKKNSISNIIVIFYSIVWRDNKKYHMYQIKKKEKKGENKDKDKSSVKKKKKR